jgi:integrase
MEDWKKSKLIIVPDTGKGETIEEAKAFERFINELKNTDLSKYQKMISKGNNITYKKLTIEKAFNDFLQYKERYKQLKEDTLNDYKTTYNYLMLFLDKTDDVLKINETFSIIFLDTMTKLPKNLLKKPEFKDKTLKQILEITERNNFELLNNKTINKHKNNLSEFCKYLITYKKVMKYNPFSNLEDLKTTESKKEIFDIVEIQRMFNDNEFFDNEDKDFLKIALCTGLRVKEISNIKKKDIKNNIISIKDSKTKSGIRQIPIHSIIQDLEVFKNMKNLKEEDFIFYGGKTSDSISKKLNRKIKNFTNDNPNKTLHSLRGNFVSLLYKNKTFIPILKKLVGHTQKQDVTFYVYNKDFVDIEELMKAI